VSYNIWSTDAKDVEKNILDEIAFAATMGVDLFYLDASWYKGSSTRAMAIGGRASARIPRIGRNFRAD